MDRNTCRQQQKPGEQEQVQHVQVQEPENCQKEEERASQSLTEDVEEDDEGDDRRGLRKGASEPVVWEEEQEQGRRGRRTFLSYLGIRRECEREEERERHGSRSRLRKTLSSMFHLKRKQSGSGEVKGKENKSNSTASKFRLPGLSRKAKAIPPSQRALPPPPPSGDQEASPPGTPSSSQEAEGSPRLEAGEEGGGSSWMDFAASIEKVKDHGWYWGPLSGGRGGLRDC